LAKKGEENKIKNKIEEKGERQKGKTIN